MRRLFVGLVLLGACARDVTAPRVLRLVPSIRPQALVGVFTDGVGQITSNAQRQTVGKSVVVTVKAIDQDSTPVANVLVAWNVIGGSGSTTPVTTVTDSIGNATVTWTLDTLAKLDSIRASISQGASAVLWATGVAGFPTTVTKVSGDSLQVAAGVNSAPIALRVTDRYGNPNSAQTFAWLMTGGGTLSALTGRTDANGTATVTLTDAPLPGVYHVIATFAWIPAVTFTVIAK